MHEAELEAYYDRLEKFDRLWADYMIASDKTTDTETTTTTEITDDVTTSPDEF